MNDDRRADKASLVEQALKDHHGPLLRYACRIAGDAERGADAVQEAFVRLWKGDPPPGPAHLAQWLFTVCRNAALDARRKEARMSTLTEAAAQARASNDPGPHERLEAQESAGEAMHALAALPQNQQEVVRLKFQNGFSYRQIAGITGLSESNVGFLIHTAIKNIRHKLGVSTRPARA
jgi:RNA polymerase sigma-70 factor (ECF subfamily)